jgi:hypothetical protein
MKNLKTFDQFVNEQELNEINWAKVPLTNAWRKARAGRKRAEEEAKTKAAEEKLDKHNRKMLGFIKQDYDAYTKQIKKNFKNDPEAIDDKILYLKHYIWASLNDFGWDEKVLTDLHKKGKFDAELKKLMTHETNPRGASWPAYVWFQDLEPDLNDIHTNITKPKKGYKKDY